MNTYFNCHNHTMYSNIRLLDSINRPKDLIDTAIQLGLSGIAITDHECLSAHMEVNQYAKKIKETHPDFKIALGNEIYLVDERKNGQPYYHFLLIAKNATGHKALREMSSIAWYNSYSDRGMERVPLTKEEMAYIVKKYPNSLIATTACMGGELSKLAYAHSKSTTPEEREEITSTIFEFINYCQDLFGEDFYIECAPANTKDQIVVNSQLEKIAKTLNIKLVVGTDAHYLTKEQRPIHKAYLNSKDGDREVDSFYEFSRLMDYEEAEYLLSLSLENPVAALKNTLEIQEKIEDYSLEKKQIIPKVEVKHYPRGIGNYWGVNNSYRDELEISWPTIYSLLLSEEPQERYWINECLTELLNKGLWSEEYLSRIEIEADIVKFIGEKLDDCLFAYFNTFKHYIDLFWECGSIVGPGRGSATGFLSNYLLGITQLDPIRWNINYWRFLNKERAELPDIDIDLAPSKRPAIFEAIRKERGEFGLIQVATFGTEGTKSAILTACRGYRSDDYPEGIDVDQGQYMASLVPQERGFLWSINDIVYGNPEKGRKPVTLFLHTVQQYPGLLDIIISIEGLINKRSCHASGVILYGTDPFETASFMRTPSGDLITCYDLHKAEAAGDTKYDLLVTEMSDKIIKCFELLQNDSVIEQDSLRNLYNKYLHPEVIDTTNPLIWSHLAEGDVLDVFQFSTGVGLDIAKKLKPQNPIEMTAANAMMRLMSEKGKESQQDRYYRIQHKGIYEFQKEMILNHIPNYLQDILHKHCDKYFGCCPLQEQMMEILMDAANFSLAEANSARKIVAKKLMDKIPELKQQVYDKVGDDRIADYLWELAVAPQLGYAFSYNHSLPYSFVGIQSIILATQFSPLYWSTACLIINSGAADEEAGGSTDFGKIAKAIGDIKESGIEIFPVNINESQYTFTPSVKENKIYFGLKGLYNVGEDIIAAIMEKRPFSSPKDFVQRVNPKKSQMISLIKAGAFDSFMERKLCMASYIWDTCDKKQRLTLQNIPTLMKYNLIPDNDETLVFARRIYEFNRYLKAITKADPYKTTGYYTLDTRAIDFLNEIDYPVDSLSFLESKAWDKAYHGYMNIFRDWISECKEELLQKLNDQIFLEAWNKYALGSYSAWEMEIMCFYYHEHELAKVNTLKYGLSDFSKLPVEPVVEKSFIKGGRTINMFKLSKIYGTCIAKNKSKSTVSLLTPSGVVEVKFRKEYFALFDKQISQKQPDGSKKIMEKSWFNRGNMIIVQGVRMGDSFIPKKYASSGGHQLYKITEVLPNGEIVLQTERYQGDYEDE